MVFTDFIVKWDSNVDSEEELTKRILYSIVIRRLLFKKPTIMGLFGGSGEGKSMSSLRLQELLLEIQGLDIKEYLDIMNIFNPLEYSEKVDKILNDKEYKKCNIICMHEARAIIKAKQWQSFLTQAVADVNAMSRAIKPLCIMIASQFIKDITKEVRYTLNYYITINRPMGGNRRARLRIYVIWLDDRDIEKPRIRKRRLQGYLIDQKGRYRRYIPRYLELKLPNKEVVKLFDVKDQESKRDLIKNKLDQVIKEIKNELMTEENKVNRLVDWYLDHMEELNIVGKKVRNKWRVNKDFRIKHDLTPSEIKRFEKNISEKLNYKPKEEQEVLKNE